MRHRLGITLLFLLLASVGCTKRQILPATIAGVGGGTMTGGFIYSATLPGESGFFGDSAADAATIGGLVFGGMALVITGVLFAVTSADCDSDADCWAGDVCVLDSHTCVDAESVVVPSPPADEPSLPEDSPESTPEAAAASAPEAAVTPAPEGTAAPEPEAAAASEPAAAPGD
jgi:hypothetical protein